MTDTDRPRIEPTEFPDMKNVYAPDNKFDRIGVIIHWPRLRDDARVWIARPTFGIAPGPDGAQRYLELIDLECPTAEATADALYAAWLRFEGVEA